MKVEINMIFLSFLHKLRDVMQTYKSLLILTEVIAFA